MDWGVTQLGSIQATPQLVFEARQIMPASRVETMSDRGSSTHL